MKRLYTLDEIIISRKVLIKFLQALESGNSYEIDKSHRQIKGLNTLKPYAKRLAGISNYSKKNEETILGICDKIK